MTDFAASFFSVSLLAPFNLILFCYLDFSGFLILSISQTVMIRFKEKIDKARDELGPILIHFVNRKFAEQSPLEKKICYKNLLRNCQY